MILNLRTVVERIPLKFSTGHSELLKSLMLKDDDNFLDLYQFKKRLKNIFPEIDIADIQEDWLFNFRKASAIFRFCKEYDKHKGSLVVPKFVYRENIHINTGIEFKLYDCVVRPFNDKFWNKYLPPNFPGDNSEIRCVYNEEITTVPWILFKKINSSFYCDLNKLFFNDIESGKLSIPPPLKSTNIRSATIDITQNVADAIEKGLREYAKSI